MMGVRDGVAIEIQNESGVDVDTDAIRDVARHTLEQTGVSPLAELSILLVDAAYMSDLNHRWMGGEGPTDVLAFPMDEAGANFDHGPGENASDPALLGDIVLCPEVAERNAAAAGHTSADEVALLTVHGTLHLLGYDHAEPEEEREMFRLQARLLDSWRHARTG
jgi:probable rRNA maturation factor